MSRGNSFVVFALALLMASLAFSQTAWQRYEGNPVLTPQADWEAGGNINNTIVKVGNEYKHWYTGIGNRFRIGMATSIDGIHWKKSNVNPVLDVGSPGEFDSEHVYNPMVVYRDSLYWMWYAGYNGANWQIGLATSNDGIQWKKHPNNPVFKIGNPGQWDDKHLTAPFVMRDGAVFKMWYRGESAALPGKGSTGYAESPDGVHWERYSGNPVFGPAPTAWDSRSLTIYPVVKREGKYEGWYGGSDGSVSQFGYVTSADGIHWQRYPHNPVMSPTRDNSWESDQISSPFVLFEKNIYKMWYSGYGPNGWRIGYATSQPTLPPISKRLVFLPRVYGLPGDTITVTLSADSIAGISGGDVVVKFDPEALSVIKAQTTEFTRNFLIAANLDTPGVARVSLAGAHGAEGGLGGLFSLRMIVNPLLPNISLSRSLKLTHAVFYTEDSQPLPITKRDGEFILGRSRGDVNRDGVVNAADAVLTLRIVAGLLLPTPSQFADADVDANGHVESIDASCILRRAVGWACLPGGASNIAAQLVIFPFAASTGQEVEAQISIKEMDKLLSGDVTLRYEANACEILEIRPSPDMPGATSVVNLNESGKVKFSFASANGFPTNNLAVVRLRAKSKIDEKNLHSITATLFDGQGRRWNTALTNVDETTMEVPDGFHLEQNYPNPFYRPSSSSLGAFGTSSTQTQINYTLPQRTPVKLMIYDLQGRLVRILENAEKTAGRYTQRWDGTDAFGAPVASGFYVYRLEAASNVLSKTMLVIE